MQFPVALFFGFILACGIAEALPYVLMYGIPILLFLGLITLLTRSGQK